MFDVVKNWKVYGFDDSVKASKYPMSVDIDKCTSEVTERTKSLAGCMTGTGHDQFLTGIVVQFDLTFSNKAWVEAERYHFLDFVSSQSTMHRITKFDLKSQCNRYVDCRIIDVVQDKINDYNYLSKLETESPARAEAMKELYLEILYNIPAGFQLTARMTTNYRQLKTIYQQRKHHRLPEWREFCRWIESLPHADLIVGEA